MLETVQTVWQPVLAASVYKPAFEKLVNAVVTRLINEVLAFDDISVEEGEKVKLSWDINVRFDPRITLLRLSKKLLFLIHNVGFFFPSLNFNIKSFTVVFTWVCSFAN